MIIFIFGNIGSGKSTIAKRLLLKLRYSYYSIDDFRKDFSDGSVDGENLAKKEFLKAISKKEFVIIESLGVGNLNHRLYEIYKNNLSKKIVVLLDVPKEICFERLRLRNWDIPFPKSYGTFEQIWENTHHRLFVEQQYLKWEKLPNCIFHICRNTTHIEFNNIIKTIKSDGSKRWY
jgi:adenylate kinase family enzyme